MGTIFLLQNSNSIEKMEKLTQVKCNKHTTQIKPTSECCLGGTKRNQSKNNSDNQYQHFDVHFAFTATLTAEISTNRLYFPN